MPAQLTPLAQARASARVVLAQAAGRLGSSQTPDGTGLRFRPDGRGGELASPFPMRAQLDPEALAAAAEAGDFFEEVFPSGTWIGLQMSPKWRETVRRWNPQIPKCSLQIPPQPDFPARISPEDWALDVLLGQTDPETAARLDRENPARRIRLACRWAGQVRGTGRESRYLVNLGAVLEDALAGTDGREIARGMLALTDAYLDDPGEDALVQQLLRTGLDAADQSAGQERSLDLPKI